MRTLAINKLEVDVDQEPLKQRLLKLLYGKRRTTKYHVRSIDFFTHFKKFCPGDQIRINKVLFTVNDVKYDGFDHHYRIFATANDNQWSKVKPKKLYFYYTLIELLKPSKF